MKCSFHLLLVAVAVALIGTVAYAIAGSDAYKGFCHRLDDELTRGLAKELGYPH